MHEERDTLWHFVMSIVKYRESRYVTVLDMFESTKRQRKRSKFKVLKATWTHNSKSLILYIKFYGALTGWFLAQFVNNIECEQTAIIAK